MITIYTNENEVGVAAHPLTVVKGHVLSTSLVFSSTLMIDSRVTPRRRGTSLLLKRTFSCNNIKEREFAMFDNYYDTILYLNHKEGDSIGS